MSTRISIVGLGLRYPDADDAEQYWENILGRRRAFRDLPEERMNPDDYWASDASAPDRFYARKAAVLRGFEFDRSRFKVSGPTYRSTDLTHWLALTVAAEAWADSGLSEDLAHRTSVVLGNTLTGEFSRAQTMRLRWPYVRRVVGSALQGEEWDDQRIASFLQDLEDSYKSAFEPITEDTLAGGLSNTIAGRICNHFDFRGGGFTVDGACSSSLLSTITAIRSLCDRDIDVAIAGGVDLSIDPFEMVGFAKTNALATGTMKIYDEHSNGFWPGEGCGMVVLMREEDAHAAGAHVYATITGWGVSSDGRGGMTRPEMTGHVAAIEQAYQRAGYPVGTVDYFEGHGTGTPVGDTIEIRAIGSAVADSQSEEGHSPALGSVKGNIGHTKAAAGVAGLIKATLALHHGVIPPVTGQDRASVALAEVPLHVPHEPEAFPTHRHARAGVSSMGFGGSNAHIALESVGVHERIGLDERGSGFIAGQQDAELLVVAAPTPAELEKRLEALAVRLPRVSLAELGDLSAELAEAAASAPGGCRASAVVKDPDHALIQVRSLLDAVRRGTDVRPGHGTALSLLGSRGRLGFLFPGQGSGSATRSFLARRFPAITKPVVSTRPGTFVDTHVAQPRIAADSAHALAVLRSLGIEAERAAGHSLGELTALHWSGSLTGQQLAELAALRGSTMAEHSTAGGQMANLGADRRTVERLLEDAPGDVCVAGVNAPAHTVVSGDPDAVEDVVRRAGQQGISAQQLRVSHAFHSTHVDHAVTVFADLVARSNIQSPRPGMVSTLTGNALDVETDLACHLAAQMRRPVLFAEAVETIAADVDLMVEVGPGRTLATLAGLTSTDVPVLSLDSDAESAVPFLTVVGAAWTLGAIDNLEAVHAGRVLRALPATMTFLASPCESVPQGLAPAHVVVETTPVVAGTDGSTATETGDLSVIDVLRTVFAEHSELSIDAISADICPLDDLHLSSITVSQLATEAARRVGREALPAATNLATITIGELAEALTTASSSQPDTLDGVGPWVRAFELGSRVQPLPIHVPVHRSGTWEVVDDGLDPEVRERLTAGLQQAGIGSGVLAVVTEDETGSATALTAAQLASRDRLDTLVLLLRADDGSGSDALVKSFALEHPETRCVVLHHASSCASAEHLDLVVDEVRTLTVDRFREVSHDADGVRRTPLLQLRTSTTASRRPLQAGDLLVVSGGGKGIVAESAITLGRRWGVTLGLLGRAHATDDEVSATLARLVEHGIAHRYVSTDVSDPDQVQAAMRSLEADLGPVRGLLHGAGTNTPGSIESLGTIDLDSAAAVKVAGLRHLLNAVDVDGLRLLVSYSSIIGRAGLHGEAHYAAANSRLTALTEQFAAQHRHVQAHSLEWSVWEGTGMGVRLGVLESLRRDGISPLAVDDALQALVEVTEDPTSPVTLVLASRLGSLPTAVRERSTIPLMRFLESVKVDYPGVELVADVNLGLRSDLYLDDHGLDGDRLFPAVLGIEAMSEVARVVTGRDAFDLEDAEFLRPITVRPDQSTVLRIAALVDPDGRVRVVLRSSETSFAADHFRAVLVDREPLTGHLVAPDTARLPAQHLYGPLFFQGARFQQVQEYRHVSAYEVTAELGVSSTLPWFAAHLPSKLVLGNPGTRDALMHAIQTCVPDGVLLPVGVRRIRPAADFGSEPVVMHARESFRDGPNHWYDVQLADASGRLLEEWVGLHLRSVRQQEPSSWEPALIGPHLQRTLQDHLGREVSVAVVDAADRERGRDLAVSRAAGRRVSVLHGVDGRPLLEGVTVSVSHAGDITLAVVSDLPRARLGCDVEQVQPRDPAVWQDMLGVHLWGEAVRIAEAAGEDVDTAATRVWGTLECLRKAGSAHDRLVLDKVVAPGKVVLEAPGGDQVITARAATGSGRPELVLCVLTAPDAPDPGVVLPQHDLVAVPSHT